MLPLGAKTCSHSKKPGRADAPYRTKAMRKSETVLRLRIFMSEADKYKGHPLYEEIVVQAQQVGLAGATVFRGQLGYSASSALDMHKLLGRSKDVPVVIEILDSEHKIQGFLDVLDRLLTNSVAIAEPVQLYRYPAKARGHDGPPDGRLEPADRSVSEA
jgi:PII-like signaling protein